MMKAKAMLKKNRTGITANEDLGNEMKADTAAFPPSSSGPPIGADSVRIEYARESEARGLGTVPAPVGLKGKAKTTVDMFTGRDPVLFMDKLGERIGFERTGTRLYEALISKLEADGGFAGGPSRRELVEILNEEHRHFAMLVDVMKSLGGDPTAITPSADVASTASMGVMKVITDARTTLLQSLEAILIAELTDREGWEALIELAREAGKDELVAPFQDAELVESRHIADVRRWVAAGQHRGETPVAAE